MPFVASDDLFRYAAKVAANLLIGLYRKSRKVAGFEPSEIADNCDVAAQVQDRLRLDAVLKTIATMDPVDRAAILQELNGHSAWSEREYRMWKMRRSRARHRLRNLLEGVAAFVMVRRRWLPGSAHPELAVAASWLVPIVAVALGAAVEEGARSAERVVIVATSTTAPSPPPAALPGSVDKSTSPPPRQRRPPVVGEQTHANPSPPLIETPPTDRRLPSGTVTPYDGDELSFCTQDDPVLNTGCPVVIKLPPGLP